MEKYLRVRYVFKLPAPFHLQLEQQLGSWQQHVLPPSVVLVTFRLPPHVAFGDALLQLRRLVLLPFVCAWLLPCFRFAFGGFGLGNGSFLLRAKAFLFGDTLCNTYVSQIEQNHTLIYIPASNLASSSSSSFSLR